MKEKIRTIRLYGRLGARFGRVHRLAVSSAAEAVRALGVLLPGFRQELASSSERGVAYAVFIGRENIGKDQLDLPPGREDIRIAPVLQGSKRAGIFQIIVGVALIVVGVITQQYNLAYMGGAMALGGVIQMLSPVTNTLSSRDSPSNGASYNFNGPINTSAQGNPVPLLYGRMIVGSAVISAGIYAEDQV
ncbi:tail assembly protein [Cupriavidus pampae]|uniref:Tail assembly protein n=1 Tax=Cupriavidus pampae TaxID=659251 RepID=A0ABM8XCN7_9BURK|nr:tail assembly protein [Cupriavidus pampae]CAG9177782.1 hypothetical protein LMG32289_03905 [Cupriavidus pampae]